jgi:hypothetical protein
VYYVTQKSSMDGVAELEAETGVEPARTTPPPHSAPVAALAAVEKDAKDAKGAKTGGTGATCRTNLVSRLRSRPAADEEEEDLSGVKTGWFGGLFRYATVPERFAIVFAALLSLGTSLQFVFLNDITAAVLGSLMRRGLGATHVPRRPRARNTLVPPLDHFVSLSGAGLILHHEASRGRPVLQNGNSAAVSPNRAAKGASARVRGHTQVRF